MLSDGYSRCSLIEAAHNEKNDPFDPRMRKAENFLTAHYKEPFCLDAAAAECNLSRRRFNDLFKTAFGQTPNRYVINRKIRYAEGLLKSSYLNVSDIAELCGFSDIYYFSRVFKTETGFSPSEYRKIGFGNDL